jgi:hypothetical protein
MAGDSRFDDIYLRLNELTQDVANLKIQGGTIGTSQVAIAQSLSLAAGIVLNMRDVKVDIYESKAEIRNLNARVKEVLRLLNGGYTQREFKH